MASYSIVTDGPLELPLSHVSDVTWQPVFVDSCVRSFHVEEQAARNTVKNIYFSFFVLVPQYRSFKFNFFLCFSIQVNFSGLNCYDSVTDEFRYPDATARISNIKVGSIGSTTGFYKT